jgi:hypothetical protein
VIITLALSRTNYNGGTCWMKYGFVTRDNAYYVSNTGVICGLLWSLKLIWPDLTQCNLTGPDPIKSVLVWLTQPDLTSPYLIWSTSGPILEFDKQLHFWQTITTNIHVLKRESMGIFTSKCVCIVQFRWIQSLATKGWKFLSKLLNKDNSIEQNMISLFTELEKILRGKLK